MVINTKLIYYFVNPGLVFEIFFEKDGATERQMKSIGFHTAFPFADLCHKSLLTKGHVVTINCLRHCCILLPIVPETLKNLALKS